MDEPVPHELLELERDPKVELEEPGVKGREPFVINSWVGDDAHARTDDAGQARLVRGDEEGVELAARPQLEAESAARVTCYASMLGIDPRDLLRPWLALAGLTHRDGLKRGRAGEAEEEGRACGVGEALVDDVDLAWIFNARHTARGKRTKRTSTTTRIDSADSGKRTVGPASSQILTTRSVFPSVARFSSHILSTPRPGRVYSGDQVRAEGKRPRDSERTPYVFYPSRAVAAALGPPPYMLEMRRGSGRRPMAAQGVPAGRG